MDIKEDQVRPQIFKLQIFHLCVNPSCQVLHSVENGITDQFGGAYVQPDLDAGVLVSSTGTGNRIRFTSALVRDSSFVIELWEAGVS